MRLLPIIVCVALASSARAEIPQLVTHVGRLLDGQDKLIDATLDITVTLHSKSVDAVGDPNHNLVWSQKYAGVHVVNGIYTLLIGDPDKGRALTPKDLESGVWLGITIADGEEMAPRLRLTSAPWAMYAGDSAMLGGLGPSAYARAAHLHAPADVTGFGVAAAAAAESSGLFAQAAHKHPTADVTGFDGAAAAAAKDSGFFASSTHSHVAADVTDFDFAATAAAQAAGVFAATKHAHVPSDVTGFDSAAVGAVQAGAVNLAAGSKVAGQAISTGPHTTTLPASAITIGTSDVSAEITALKTQVATLQSTLAAAGSLPGHTAAKPFMKVTTGTYPQSQVHDACHTEAGTDYSACSVAQYMAVYKVFLTGVSSGYMWLAPGGGAESESLQAPATFPSRVCCGSTVNNAVTCPVNTSFQGYGSTSYIPWVECRANTEKAPVLCCRRQ